MDFGTGTGTGGSETLVSSAAPRRKGFFRSLVDISFTSFVTGRVVKFIYVLSVVFVVLYVILTTVYLAFIAYSFVSAFAESEALGIIVAVVLFIILIRNPGEGCHLILAGDRESAERETTSGSDQPDSVSLPCFSL